MKVKMTFINPVAVFIITGVLIIRVNAAVDNPANASHNNSSDRNETPDHGHGPPPDLKVAKFDFAYVSGPLTIIVWILIASLAKLVFHLSHKLSSIVPESCLVIVLGIVIGGLMKAIGIADVVPNFSSRTFFLFMLPPIVLEAGYFLQDRAFFSNIGTILLYAVVGTIFNTFTVGLSLFGSSGKMGHNLTLMHTLTFAALIAAVDPVAVLAVFEEIHVNVMLYILVFGESLLNDAVTVVLYHLFEGLAGFDEVTYKEILIGFASFFVVSIGGTLLGLLWGLATAFITKYTDHVRVIEPIFVFVMSYLAYLTAELFHLSGIMSIVTCAIVMKPYVELNISRKSHTTIKYFLKMLSSSSETLIFMFLGVEVVSWDHEWNTQFVFVTLIFLLLYRALSVVILTFLANKFGRLNKLSAVDQFIMSYGGIRGAVSFSLAILLDERHFPMKNMFVTTTIVIVLFTVFFQGMTIKPLVRILHVKLRGKEQVSMCAELNQKFLDHLVAGIEEISGQHGHGYYREMLEHFHTHYLRRWLIRDSYQFVEDEEILLTYRRLAYKDALTRLERESSGSALVPSVLPVELLAKSAFEASAITSSESGEEDDESKPMLRAGEDVRVPDAIQVDWKAAGVPSGGELEIHDTSTHSLNNLIERNRRSYRHRKMYRNNLMDDDEDFFRERGYLFPMKPRATAYQNQILVNAKPIHYHHRHKPRHHHKKHKHHKRHEEPPKKQLSAIFEEEDGAGRTSPTAEAPVGPIPTSSEDDEPGITFEAKARGRVGRYPSFESKDAAPDESVSEDKTDKAENEKDESKPTEDSPTEPDGIPLDSFVVEIDGEKTEEKNAESEM